MLALTGVAGFPATAIAQNASLEFRQEVVTVEVRPDVTMKHLLIQGSDPPIATVILLAGGDGVLALQPSGTIASALEHNVLIRARERFARAGLAVAAVDAASDLPGGMDARAAERSRRQQLPPGSQKRTCTPMVSCWPRSRAGSSGDCAAGPSISRRSPPSARRCSPCPTATTAVRAVPAVRPPA
jgi:hypothetical protein